MRPVVIDKAGELYGGFFESLVNRLLDEVEDEGRRFAYKNIIIYARPFVPYAVQASNSTMYKDTLVLDFYSALRHGFGALSEEDERGLKRILCEGRKERIQ